MTCKVPRCRQPMVLVYLIGSKEYDICDGHWAGHGERYHLHVLLGRAPEDFMNRVRLLKILLKKGNRQTQLRMGSKITGKLDLLVYRPYLSEELQSKLPVHWTDLNGTENQNDQSDQSK